MSDWETAPRHGRKSKSGKSNRIQGPWTTEMHWSKHPRGLTHQTARMIDVVVQGLSRAFYRFATAHDSRTDNGAMCEEDLARFLSFVAGDIATEDAPVSVQIGRSSWHTDKILAQYGRPSHSQMVLSFGGFLHLYLSFALRDEDACRDAFIALGILPTGSKIQLVEPRDGSGNSSNVPTRGIGSSPPGTTTKPGQTRRLERVRAPSVPGTNAKVPARSKGVWGKPGASTTMKKGAAVEKPLPQAVGSDIKTVGAQQDLQPPHRKSSTDSAESSHNEVSHTDSTLGSRSHAESPRSDSLWSTPQTNPLVSPHPSTLSPSMGSLQAPFSQGDNVVSDPLLGLQHDGFLMDLLDRTPAL